ncbi:MAG: hypothetical protein KAX44_07775, partial [Candidatus Brocadiae bacterium]|nr:hypothetical protein [Candidatus Brocadiia bacterium]
MTASRMFRRFLRGLGVPRGDRSARTTFDGRRGAALMIALIVLTALFLLAIPFAAFMRRQHASATQALHMANARFGQAGALNHAQTVLAQGLYAIERERGLSTTPADLFPFNDPDVDTLWEFRITLRTQVTAAWDDAGDRMLRVQDALGFPNDGNLETVDGYVRVGDGANQEWMAYSNVENLDPAAMAGDLRVKLEHRGMFGTQATVHSIGATVSFFPEAELWHLNVDDPQTKINLNSAPYRVIRNLLGYLGIGDESALPIEGPGDVGFPDVRQQAIAAAIYAPPSDPSARFQSLDMVNNVAPLTADELDLLRPYVTVQSGYPGGSSPWLRAVRLESDINPTFATGDYTDGRVANLSDASGIGVGSLVHFVWSGGDVYRTVLSKNSSPRPLDLAQDWNGVGDIVLRWVAGCEFVGASGDTPCYIKL